jgi:hypothetical protein
MTLNYVRGRLLLDLIDSERHSGQLVTDLKDILTSGYAIERTRHWGDALRLVKCVLIIERTVVGQR